MEVFKICRKVLNRLITKDSKEEKIAQDSKAENGC